MGLGDDRVEVAGDTADTGAANAISELDPHLNYGPSAFESWRVRRNPLRMHKLQAVP
jgi:hypothetical protein